MGGFNQWRPNMSTPTAVEIARRLIRYPTVNPPGSELAAQNTLQGILEEAGFEVRRFECASGRPNLIARLAGRNLRPPLLFYGHVDVVGVDGQNWDVDPFAGIVQNDLLYGRGALDMKAGLAMLVHSMTRAKKDHLRPSGDIVLAVVVDEESGGEAGMKYLLEEHPDLFDGVRHAIGEFGGFPLHAFGKKFYRIGVSQKQYVHLHLNIRGRSGHGSLPARNTVMLKLGKALKALDQTPLRYQKPPIAEHVINTMCEVLPEDKKKVLSGLLDPERFDSALSAIGAGRERFESLFRSTANATIVAAGKKFNVIPSEARIEVDARLLPGDTVPTLIAELQSILGDEVSIEIAAAGPPTKSDIDYTLFEPMAGILLELDPEGIPIPYMFNESPDGRLLEEHGMQNYGFLPMNLPEDFDLPAMIHAENESIPLSAISFGAEAVYRLMRQY